MYVNIIMSLKTNWSVIVTAIRRHNLIKHPNLPRTETQFITLCESHKTHKINYKL